jgi:hypothetical protein
MLAKLLQNLVFKGSFLFLTSWIKPTLPDVDYTTSNYRSPCKDLSWGAFLWRGGRSEETKCDLCADS